MSPVRRVLLRIAVMLLVLSGTAVGSSSVAAQVRFDGIEGTISLAGWSGQDVRTLEEDVRFSVAPLLRLGTSWQVGVEAYASDVGFGRFPAEFEWHGELDRRGDEVGVGALVRRIFGDPEARHLYAQVRAGWTELDTEVFARPTLPNPEQDDVVESFSTTGFAVGPEVGISFAPRYGVRLLVAAGLTWNRYEDTEIFGPFHLTFGEQISAYRWGVRAGLMLENPFG